MPNGSRCETLPPNTSLAPWQQPANPFASRFVSPHCRSYRFDDSGDNLESIVSHFLATSRPSILLGPHGTGKTTLLNQMVECLKAKFLRVERFTLHDQQRATGLLRLAVGLPPHSLIVLDGLEQAGPLQRRLLAMICRARNLRCLATSHSRTRGYSVLYQTTTSVDFAKKLVVELLCDFPHRVPEAQRFIDRHWAEHNGNLRDLWFSMYDWFSSLDPTPKV